MEQPATTDRIADIFDNRTIFISGATGFVGKALIEKLLRLTNLKKLYLLIRTKKGKSPNDRLLELFNNVLFDILRNLKPDFMKKCQVITGDVIQESLGICKEERELLIKECEFIFHSAATTRFDESIHYSVLLNTRGTLYMLNLAEECKQLKLFVHVSTAFAFPTEAVMMEKAYRPSMDAHDVLSSLNWISSEAMGRITKELLGEIPNTYTFSKALAESLVNEKVGKLPVIICRPAIVVPSLSDPFPGWFNNLQGPIGLFVGSGKGIIRSMYMDSKSHANLIPIDSTVGSLMLFTWYYLSTKNAPYIYNICVPESDLALNWEQIIDYGREVVRERVPFNSILWYPDGSMTKSKVVNKLNVFLFQIIPALLIDALVVIVGYKPFLYSIQRRIIKCESMFHYYTTQAWHFGTNNLENVRILLTDKEKSNYQLTADNFDIKDYLANAILMARRHILKETDEMLPAARRNMKIMYAVDKVVKLVFYTLLGYYFYKLLIFVSEKFLINN